MGATNHYRALALVASLAAASGCAKQAEEAPLAAAVAAPVRSIDQSVLDGATQDDRAGAGSVRIAYYTEFRSLRFGERFPVRIEFTNRSTKTIPAASLGASVLVLDENRAVIGVVLLAPVGGDLAPGANAAFEGRLSLKDDVPRTHCEQTRTVLWNAYVTESGRLTDYDQARSNVRIDCNGGLGYTVDQVPDEQALVAEVDRDYPGLMATNCAAFQRRVMERLRAKDRNWGYCNTATLTWGDRFMYGPLGAMVDAVVSACGPSPRVGWRLEPFNPICVWGSTQLLPQPQDP
jgi:hypothetical protein